MLYEPTRFDALIDEPWVPARVEDTIAAIVADADAAFDRDALWPAHEWDAQDKPLPLSGLYVGAAGVIWALDELEKRGHADSSRDLASAASSVPGAPQLMSSVGFSTLPRTSACTSSASAASEVSRKATSSAPVSPDISAPGR